MQSRRHFLQKAVLATGAVSLDLIGMLTQEKRLACQQYTWFNYYQRQGIDWFADKDASFKAFKSSGLTGFEPAFSTLQEVQPLVSHLQSVNIWSESLYVNSLLHEEESAEESMHAALNIVQAALPLGIRIAVTNPSPLDWSGKENKSDRQLSQQAKALNQLGADMKEMGVMLAYHNHDAEMRASAREFHHMMLETDPENVKLCLDAHWVYRGAGDSEVALFDIIKLYGDRIVELHVRQSQNGIWSEVFGDGDINYRRLVDEVGSRAPNPLVVLEQAVEQGTPHTLSTVEAQKRSRAYIAEVFEPFL